MKAAKAACLGFFAFLSLGMVRPLGATVIDISVDTAHLTIVLLEGTIKLVTNGGEVLTLEEGWKGGISGDKLRTKAVNDLTECNDRLLGLQAILETVLEGDSVPQHTAHTEGILAKAAFEPVGKIVRAGATDETIKLFSPLEEEINRRLKEIVALLTPSQTPSVDCSSCGDPACCTAGSKCCLDANSCPNGCR